MKETDRKVKECKACVVCKKDLIGFDRYTTIINHRIRVSCGDCIKAGKAKWTPMS